MCESKRVSKIKEDLIVINGKLNKQIYTEKIILILDVTNSLLEKAKKVKEGIDRFQKEVLKPNKNGKPMDIN